MVFVKTSSESRFMCIRVFLALLFTILLLSCRKNSNSDTGDPSDPPDTTENREPVTLTTRVITNDLTYPWDIFMGFDGHIWMTERGGRISRVDPASGEVKPLLTIGDVHTRGEGGLLGIALTAPVDGGRHLFVAYNYQDGEQYKQKIVRYLYANEKLSDPQLIYNDILGAGIHNGCRLVISNDNKLLATTGDASDQTLSQSFDSKNGKVLRFNLDGTIPGDNPDPASPVWSLGHRNAQGLVFVNDSLFSSEHGPDTDDEINMIHRAGNYGWPDVKGACDAAEQAFCDEHNVVEPLMSWTPTIAPSGMEYYNSDSIPQWKNSLLVCTLKDATLYQLKLNNSQEGIADTKTFFRNDFGRLRDVCSSPDGRVYLCTSNGTNDQLIEVSWE